MNWYLLYFTHVITGPHESWKFFSFPEPVDMFSDEPTVSTNTVSSTSSEHSPSNLISNEVKWEYRWENKDEAELHGPFTSTQMLEWKDNGLVIYYHYFNKYFPIWLKIALKLYLSLVLVLLFSLIPKFLSLVPKLLQGGVSSCSSHYHGNKTTTHPLTK